MLSDVRKERERERGQFSSKTAIVCLPPGTHLTDCHENKLESLQFQIIAYHVLLHRQKQTLLPPSSPPGIHENISQNFHPFIRGKALQLVQTITIQRVCLFSAAFKMIYYLLLFFFLISRLSSLFLQERSSLSLCVITEAKRKPATADGCNFHHNSEPSNQNRLLQ